ncbi:MAG: hypothetical protein AB8B65_20100 [Kordia sp.]|uniref:hypothetical protein n=1 Tax=Kordia sp. TaxID=1965332 RepID=UPI00385B12A2
MKKYILLFALFFGLQSYAQKDKTIFELKPSQSMSITGKGTGQDAAINPYTDGNSIAIIENLGKNVFEVRVQYQGKITSLQPIKSGKTLKFALLKGSELYVDSDYKGKAKIQFIDGLN